MTLALRLEGLTPYADALAFMEALVDLRAQEAVPDLLLVVEHPETITVGRHRGAASSVLTPDVPVVSVSRGGDATYHAPGQLVLYPVVALEGDRRDLRAVLSQLEEAVIDTLTPLGLAPGRDDRNTGVWLPMPRGAPRKVCSIGIACRRWVTWHGLALNVDVDLAGFRRIRPCGFGAEVMTRLADHLAAPPTVQALAASLVSAVAEQMALPQVAWASVDVSGRAEEAVRAVVAIAADHD